MKRWIRIFAISFFGAAAAIAAPAALAAGGPFPNRAVRIVVPFPAATSPDIVIRLVGEKLATLWGQPVIVENKPGAAGAIGAQKVASADPDGYTLMYTINSLICANPHLYLKLPYDALKDFKPVSIVVSLGYVLLARPDSQLTTLEKAIAFAKANPIKLNYASAGVGSGNHIVTELLASMAGIQMTHIPLGTGDPASALLTGQVDLAFSPFTNSIAMVKGGKVRALGVSTPARNPNLPDVPAIAEVVPGFSADAWHGLFVPSATPPAVIEKLSADVRKVLAMPDIRKRLEDMGLSPVGDTPQEAEHIVKSDYDKWGRVIRSANIQPQ
jgi:tripartite-type tricarboxylate transporter receptor subunit TctC